MMKFLKHSIYIALLLMCTVMVAQQQQQFTQYMYNTMAINSAYIGSRGGMEFNALYRAQWLGVDGAPVTQTLNFATPAGERIGLGAHLVNDNLGNGTYQQSRFSGVFSYSIPVEYWGKLSFGISAGGSLLDIDYTRLQNLGNSSITQEDTIDRNFAPNFGIGVYYNTNEFYIGLSTPNLIQAKHFDQSNVLVNQELAEVYFMSGYAFEIHPRLYVKPALLLVYAQQNPMVVNLSTNLIFKERFWLGANYRVGGPVSGLFGLEFKNMMLGVAYDYDLSSFGNVISNNGSFELLFKYKFKSRKGFLSPQFF